MHKCSPSKKRSFRLLQINSCSFSTMYLHVNGTHDKRLPIKVVHQDMSSASRLQIKRRDLIHLALRIDQCMASSWISDGHPTIPCAARFPRALRDDHANIERAYRSPHHPDDQIGSAFARSLMRTAFPLNFWQQPWVASFYDLVLFAECNRAPFGSSWPGKRTRGRDTIQNSVRAKLGLYLVAGCVNMLISSL